MTAIHVPLSVAETANESYTRALVLYRDDRYAEAIDVLRSVIAQEPEHAEARRLLEAMEDSQQTRGPLSQVLKQLNAERQRLRQLLSTTEQRLSRVTKEFTETQGRFSEVQAEKTQLEQALQSKNRELAEAQKTIGQLEDQLSNLQETAHPERLARLDETLTIKERELNQVKQTLAAMRQERDVLQTNLLGLQDILDERSSQLTKVQTTRFKLTEDLETFRSTLEEERQRLAALQTENEALLKDREELDQTRALLEEQASQLASVEEQRAKLEAERMVLRDHIDKRTQQLSASQDAHAELLRQFRAMDQDNATLTQELEHTRQLVAQGESERETLSETLTARERKLATLQTSRSLLLTRVGELDERLSDTAVVQRELAKELEFVRASSGESEASREASRMEFQNLKNDLRDAQQQIAQLTTELKHRDDLALDSRSVIAQIQREAEAEQTRLEREQARLEQELQQERFNFTRELEKLAQKREARVDGEQTQLLRDKFTLEGRLAAVGKERDVLVLRHTKAERDKVDLEKRVKKLTQQFERLTAGQPVDLGVDEAAPEHAKDALSAANQQLARVTEELESQQQYAKQLKELLSKREEALERLQQEPRPEQPAQRSAPPAAETQSLKEASQPDKRTAAEASAEPEITGTVGTSLYVESPAAVAAETFTAPVFSITEALGFVVLNVKEAAWAKEGAQMLVTVSDQPPLAMQIGERDKSGLAVAQIVGELPQPFPFKVGDTVSIRQLR